MANRDTNLNINVTADNQASDELRQIAAQTEALEGEHTVTVDADDQASADLEQVDQAVTELDGRTATVDVRADDNSARELDRITQDVRDLDGRRAEVTVDVDDNASRKLDAIQSKLRDMDGSSGSSLGAGIGGAVGGALGASAIIDQLTAGGDLAIQTQQVANMTGASLENASRLVTVWRNAGLDVADLLDLLANLNSVVRDTPEIAEQLKLDTSLDLVSLFVSAIGALKTEVDDVGERGVLAGKLFGEEGQRQVGEVEVRIGDLQTAMDEVGRTQLINPADVERAQQLNTEVAELKGHVQEIQLMLLETVPLLNTVLGGIASFYNGAFNAGRAVAEAGGDTRRFIEDIIGNDNVGLSEEGIIARNTGGQSTFITGQQSSGLIAGAARQVAGQVTNLVINPPGTPPSIVDGTRIYQQRNGLQ